MPPLYSVVVPYFNEEGNVPLIETELLPAARRLAGPCEIVAVDDGSADATAARLEELARRRGDVRLLRHERNRGMGAALRTGFAAARGEWVITLDSDCTFHPRLIAALVERQAQTGADCVSGSHIQGGMRGVPALRAWPSYLVNQFYRGLLSRRISAYTAVFRLYRRLVLMQLPLRCEGYEINAEILAFFILRGYHVEETPAELTTRVWGISKMRAWRELGRHLRLARRIVLGLKERG
ncbi:MAG: glycosyltransferase family 2 protein [Elusimicrobia bacterium]|nr:glycosyltransferase family 2 protein [Elusimicrobiota bacterium]